MLDNHYHILLQTYSASNPWGRAFTCHETSRWDLHLADLLLGEFSLFMGDTEDRDGKTFGSSSARYSAAVTKEPKATLTPLQTL